MWQRISWYPGVIALTSPSNSSKAIRTFFISFANRVPPQRITVGFEVLSNCICRHCRLVTVLVLDLIHPRVENGVVMRGANWQSIRISESLGNTRKSRLCAVPTWECYLHVEIRVIEDFRSKLVASFLDIIIPDNIAELFLKVEIFCSGQSLRSVVIKSQMRRRSWSRSSLKSIQSEVSNLKPITVNNCAINANNEERTKSQFFLLFFPFFFSSRPPKEFPPLLEGSSPPLVELSLS